MGKTYQCIKCGNEQTHHSRGCEDCGDEFSLMEVQPEEGDEEEDDDDDKWEKEMDENLVDDDDDEKPRKRRRRKS